MARALAEAAETSLISPKNCVIAIGVPMTIHAFNRAVLARNEGYASQFIGGWDQYYLQWVMPVSGFALTCQSMGVELLNELTATSLRERLSLPGVEALVLLSHWSENSVEFSDGFLSTDEFVSSIPEDYSGVLDLCVCHPCALISLMIAKRPNCTVRYTPQKVRPRFWLYYYEGLFRLLSAEKYSYIEAFKSLNTELMTLGARP